MYGGKSRDLKSNFSATAGPSLGDDATRGYKVGSVWIDVIASAVYSCRDASAGAAVWLRLDNVPVAFPVAVSTTPYPAVAGALLEVTTGATDITVDLPAAPSPGDRITVIKADSGAGAVTVAGGGKTINGATSAGLSTRYAKIVVVYGSTQWWIL